MKSLALTILAFLITTAHAAAPALGTRYTGPDYSGTYQCTGKDKADGDFTGKVTLTLKRDLSSGPYGAYDFRLDAPPFGAYVGEGAAQGAQMAMRFSNLDQKDKDYGTAIATFTRNKAGKWVFRSFYYEPEYKGGNNGSEECVQQ